MADEKPVKRNKVHVGDVVRHPGKLMVPDSMDLDTAIQILTSQREQENKEVEFDERIPCFPFDGALALSKALTEQFGWVQMQDTPGFWGSKPPQMIQVSVSRTDTVSVPWGRFTLPGIQGYIETGITRGDDEELLFILGCKTLKRHERRIKQLFHRVREIALSESLYRGKAFSITFTDSDDDLMIIPSVSFLPLDSGPVIFTRELEHAIETNIIGPIRYTSQCRKSSVPLKRGVLLAGEYGTGKTLTAAWLGREATENGWTFIYVPAINELPRALKFARGYQPAVVFAEDVDRIAGVDRTAQVNTLLNTLDGIDGKTSDVMVILTSNKPEYINEAMRRPGRIDVVLPVTPPDSEAASRLIRLYAGDTLAKSENLSRASELIAGQRPAVIREVVERSKLEAIWRTGGINAMLIAEDIEKAAGILLAEQQLFIPKQPVEDDITRFSHGLGSRIAGAIRTGIEYSVNDR